MRRLRTLRISVTGRCDLDCIYCNAAGPSPRRSGYGRAGGRRDRAAELAPDEIARLSEAAALAGARTVRLTGGEPLLRDDLEAIIRRVRAAGVEDVALTTNAQGLARRARREASRRARLHVRRTNAPGRARSLREAGLDRVNIGLPSLRAESYRSITGGEVAPALAGLEAALEAGFRQVKVNVVVTKGANENEIGEFVELARARPLEVRFLEHMPFSGGNDLVPARDIRSAIAASLDGEALPRPELSATAVVYRPPGFAGSLGVISPVTEPFCERCDRLRVTSEGRLRSCLSEPDEIDLRALLERGARPEELAREFGAAFDRKPERHSASFSGHMRRIGG